VNKLKVAILSLFCMNLPVVAGLMIVSGYMESNDQIVYFYSSVPMLIVAFAIDGIVELNASDLQFGISLIWIWIAACLAPIFQKNRYGIWLFFMAIYSTIQSFLAFLMIMGRHY